MHFSHSDALCTQTNASLQKHSQTGWNHKSTSSAWGKNMPILPLHDDNCGFVYFFVCKLGDFLWWLTGLGWSVNIYLEFFKKKLKNSLKILDLRNNEVIPDIIENKSLFIPQ